MTEENAADFPDIGEHDWTAMEQLANGVPTDEVEGSGETIVLTDEMILKRVLWDVAPHNRVREVGEYLGLTQTSEEGTEMEHVEVHGRMMQSMVLAPYLQMVSRAAARTIYATMQVMDGREGDVPVDSAEFTEDVSKFEAVIFAANLSAVSELLDWGLLHTPHFVMAGSDEEAEAILREMQGDDEQE